MALAGRTRRRAFRSHIASIRYAALPGRTGGCENPGPTLSGILPASDFFVPHRQACAGAARKRPGTDQRRETLSPGRDPAPSVAETTKRLQVSRTERPRCVIASPPEEMGTCLDHRACLPRSRLCSHGDLHFQEDRISLMQPVNPVRVWSDPTKFMLNKRLRMDPVF